ncbi:MmpS family transport accessory protein [Microbacterium sp. MPKO10]|uniref:MmpS family transport accessory protein n=1 Tax=Microbacterium sp. MPKO10 TaxID=2989818 RepID=UPI00223674F0|nr:MmpS family transport accessory protein [Microbacterium sp. MPKO10]MCW4459781.1 MmpS family transport accessory protein [Microbacterium sp. MPKO10]
MGIVATSALVLIGGVWLATDLGNRRTVPDLAGLTADSAKSAISDLDLHSDLHVSSEADGLENQFTSVASQDPGVGETVYEGDTITINISPALVTVPKVVGVSYREAVDALEALSFHVQHNFGDNTPGDDWKVLEQANSPGSEVAAGSTLELTVDAPLASVPQLSGLSTLDAEQEVKTAFLTSATEGDGDFVRSVDPAPGTELEPFSEVTMTLGYKVPDVVGVSASEAIDQLEEAGFTEVTLTHDSDLEVTKQSIAAGTVTSADTAIVLTVPLSGTTYRVTGNGSSALITWMGPDSYSVQQDANASLPWEKYFTSSSGFVNFSAQMNNGSSITCTVIRDGETIMEHTSTGLYAIVSCAG